MTAELMTLVRTDDRGDVSRPRPHRHAAGRRGGTGGRRRPGL